MKKLINTPDTLIDEMIDGLVRSTPTLSRLRDYSVVLRRDAAAIKDSHVALISGGGSGHEPAHAGYVGPGMLTAAVLGEVFTSPDTDSVLAAIRAVTGRAGCLLVVKNYTGDVLNFGLAAQLAHLEDISVEVVVVADDVATRQPDDRSAARGIAGTVLVHKIAGAAAAAGAPLAQVAAIARQVNEQLSSLGVALSPCIVPAAGQASFNLGPEEMELGLGIHGEPGIERQTLKAATPLVEDMVVRLVADVRNPHAGAWALLVNNLGATPTMELQVIVQAALEALEQRGMVVVRTYSGTFLTSLEMAGVSLSLLEVDDAMVAALDAPTNTLAWPAYRAQEVVGDPVLVVAGGAEAPALAGPPQPEGGRKARAQRQMVCQALANAEAELTALDQAVGDGDLGVSLKRGAEAVVQNLDQVDLDRPGAGFRTLGNLLRRHIGGSSGPFYAAFCFGVADYLIHHRASAAPTAWAEALTEGAQAIAELGGAKVGDCTMLDALMPAVEAFKAQVGQGATPEAALAKPAEAAGVGAEATKSLLPRKGRAKYLQERAVGHPDPGAVAVAIWLNALATAWRVDAKA
ncbi:MAG: dihydroxyacetone kinase subunit DhaL [Candidatus Competibacterales bacterium]